MDNPASKSSRLPEDLRYLAKELPDNEDTMLRYSNWMRHLNYPFGCHLDTAAQRVPPYDCGLIGCRAITEPVRHALQCTTSGYCGVPNCALINGMFRHCGLCPLDTDKCRVCRVMKHFARNSTSGPAGDGDANQIGSANRPSAVQEQNVLNGIKISYHLTADGFEVDRDSSEQFWQQLMAEKSTTGRKPLSEYLASQSTTTHFKPELLTAKHWHGEMALINLTSAGSVRSDTMRKLEEVLFSDYPPCDLITSYVRKLEAGIYEESCSEEHYHQLTAEKIQKELDEERERLHRKGTCNQPVLENEQPTTASAQLETVLAVSGSSERDMSGAVRELMKALQCADAELQREWLFRLLTDNPGVVTELGKRMGSGQREVGMDSGKFLAGHEGTPTEISGTHFDATKGGGTAANTSGTGASTPVVTACNERH